MAKRKTKAGDKQVDTISRSSPFTMMSFDLVKQDKFVTSLAVDFIHYKAIPSPIGQKDRGDYRRSDGVDTITSNGMIYKCAGRFSATMTDNSRGKKNSPGGEIDPSQSNLILPRFYNKDDQSDGSRIYMAPGDRLYVADPDADVKVSNYQKMDYEMGVDNVPMFPIVELEKGCPIVDSRNIEYTCNVDYLITKDGNIRWLDTGKNPGIDPDTGKGRVYAVRYLYKAYWYVISLPKEVRVTNVTTGGVRSPERMPYNATIMREYVYHNQNRSDKPVKTEPGEPPSRVVNAPQESVTPAKFSVPVDMSTIDDGDSDE